MATAPHPYWPRSLRLPGYVASERPGWQSACAVGVAAASLLAAGWALGGAKRSQARRLALGWFLMCAGIHGVLEGYFSLRHRDLPARTGLLADVCEREGVRQGRQPVPDERWLHGCHGDGDSLGLGPPQLPHLPGLALAAPGPPRPAAHRLPGAAVRGRAVLRHGGRGGLGVLGPPPPLLLGVPGGAERAVGGGAGAAPGRRRAAPGAGTAPPRPAPPQGAVRGGQQGAPPGPGSSTPNV